jgi:alpha-L-fucosidase
MKKTHEISRRELLMVGAGAAAAGGVVNPGFAVGQTAEATRRAADPDRERRMKWWHAAKFGMFIHWGVYSVYGRHEWVMEMEGIPAAEYEKTAKLFTPKLNTARDWARLAKRAGMKYMVMTTKHHEGFCLFDTKTTNYCAPKQGPGRDLVKEYVEAARAEGLRVGFYYSLMDWHHPDGARSSENEAARRRFVDYIHTHIRELMTNYGKIDILWYDVAWPLDAEGWESEKMNDMVFKLQPDIIVNNRNKLDGDFSTPEQQITAATNGRAWESCMTMNDSWGYHKADDNWKTPRTIIRNLITCSHDGGNYLLNIGPKPDGSIPEESTRTLTAVGQWLDKNGGSIYETEACNPRRCRFGSFSRKGNTLFLHVAYWPGSTVSIAGLINKVKSASMLATGQKIAFKQDTYSLSFTGLPENMPFAPMTSIAMELDGEPKQDEIFVRRRDRGTV